MLYDEANPRLSENISTTEYDCFFVFLCDSLDRKNRLIKYGGAFSAVEISCRTFNFVTILQTLENR